MGGVRVGGGGGERRGLGGARFAPRLKGRGK